MAETFHYDQKISFEIFMDRTNKVIDRVEKDAQLSNLLRGVHLRILVPPVEIKDYGQALKEIFLPAIEKAYNKQFPNKEFINHRKNDLAGQVIVVPESRYDKLILATAQGAVPAVYFPAALQGFSVDACRKVISTLPEDIILSGGEDTAAAMVGYADILARDIKTLGINMAALQWQSPLDSLKLIVGSDGLEFGFWNLVTEQADSSSGVVILG